MENYQLQQRSVKNIVIGAGAAGFQAAARLHQFGESDTVLVAENLQFGTSRNTGSDKQTYYKLSLAGDDADSVAALAEQLFAGQCVDGDQALCEAALSARCFYRLVELGVPFPCNEYGEFIGYKTDHDKGRRATSIGPYTSKVMTERLEEEVRRCGIELLDGFQAVHLFIQEGAICAVLCLDITQTNIALLPCYLLLCCENCILATGGPAGIYHDSVYPQSQLGSSGLAFEAGAAGKNLTEWQYGLASLNPRWNVSGTYMQVLPRVVSTAPDGTGEREFLLDFFDDPSHMLSLLFLKGYQWPFDTSKIQDGSSLIDLLVYQERCLKGRRVFLDYRTNSCGQIPEFAHLTKEAYTYLRSAGACFGTPIERLAHMNPLAIDFYREHGVDLYNEMLEVAVCAQHNNGGLATDAHWQTNIQGLYAVGELCGSHGVTRPGGTALNAGQVGATRAAEHISWRGKCAAARPAVDTVALQVQAQEFLQQTAACTGSRTIADAWQQASTRMSRCAGPIRELSALQNALDEVKTEFAALRQTIAPPQPQQLAAFYHLRDTLLSQLVYLSAMLDYARVGAGSRGSGLYTDSDGLLPDERLPRLFACSLDNGRHSGLIQEVCYDAQRGTTITWRPVRPIPTLDYFFENQWKAYRERMGES